MTVRVNRDASLYRVVPGNGVPVRHARAVHDGWLGSVRRRPADFAAERAGRSLRRNRSGRGRSNCKSATDASRADEQTCRRCFVMARTADDTWTNAVCCPDIGPAYVPGTVWGTASNETARFERGAVPVLCEGQALTAPSATASRRAPSPDEDPSPHRSADIAPVSSATASVRPIAGFTRVQAAIDNPASRAKGSSFRRA